MSTKKARHERYEVKWEENGLEHFAFFNAPCVELSDLLDRLTESNQPRVTKAVEVTTKITGKALRILWEKGKQAHE